MYELVIGTVYAGLATNFLLVLTTLPLVVLLMTTDPAASWSALALAAPLVAPAMSAAFAVFRAVSSRQETQVVRLFLRSWWAGLRRSLAVGAAATAVVVIAALNIGFFMSESVLGAVVIPFQVVLAAVVLVTALMALIADLEMPGARLHSVLLVGVLVAVRRFYLAVPAGLALVLWAGLLVEQPAIALGAMAAPLLFASWGTGRIALRPALPDAADIVAA